VPARFLPDTAEEDRLPNRDDRQDLVNPLGRQIGIGRSEVVVEDRLLDDGFLVAGESDAAERVLHGEVDTFVPRISSAAKNDRLELVEGVDAIIGISVHAGSPLALDTERTMEARDWV
jgi:hypothetical protein